MSTISTEGPSGLGSPLHSQFIKPSHNPIQIAAISNYKLAQLTFAPPDLDSLRKTAIIKNVLEDVYTNTPEEWLQQMTRWQFFTAESLEEMTQEGLEEIFQQYSQTIEAFRPVKSFPPPFDDIEDDLDDEDEEGEGDELWVADEEAPTPVPKTNSIGSSSSLFSQPNTNLSGESIEIRPASSLFSDKPLPANPITDIPFAVKQQQQQQGGGGRRNSGFSGNMNRLSWTSDTGITSNAISQNLANEIMNLFDMDFSVDIKLNTAPKLPELPFRPRRRSQQQQRQSQDMLSSLIPAFEKIALENSSSSSLNSTSSSSVMISSVPQRSSSLKHRQQMMEEEENANLNARVTQYKSPMQDSIDKVKPKKKSRLRLSSLIIKKHKEHKEHKDNLSSPKKTDIQNNNQQQKKPRKTSTSTIESTSSSSWSYVSDADSQTPSSARSQKPLPDAPSDNHHENNEKKKKKKKKKKGIRKQESFKSLTSEHTLEETDLSTTEYSHTTSDESIETLGIATNNFVKRMASFNWRIKSRGKVVEV